MVPRLSKRDFESSRSPDGGRRRVRKACDRCRHKKCKCDGTTPCSRCQQENSICITSERRNVRDKVYPSGYTEMLERQQIWLVRGLRELYQRITEGKGWPGDSLELESNGHPLTHDLLARLGVLDENLSLDSEEKNLQFIADSEGSSHSPGRFQHTYPCLLLDTAANQHGPVAETLREPASATTGASIEDSLNSMPLSMSGGARSSESSDVFQQELHPLFNLDLDGSRNENDPLIAPYRSPVPLDDMEKTTPSAHDTAMLPALVSSAPLSVTDIDKNATLNFSEVDYGAPLGFWKSYAV